jgi:hypothetical protein
MCAGLRALPIAETQLFPSGDVSPGKHPEHGHQTPRASDEHNEKVATIAAVAEEVRSITHVCGIDIDAHASIA